MSSPAVFNWPSFVGQQKGFFERNGITVTVMFAGACAQAGRRQ